LDLEKVKKYFEEYGEFIFRISRFHLDNMPDGSSTSASVLYFSFQNAFLNMLRDPGTQEQIEKFQAEFVPQQAAERAGKSLRLCEVAEQYFDTLLHKGIHGSVPQAVRGHILDCHECSRKFFKFALGSLMPLSDQQQFYIKSMTEQLGRHFSLLGANVYCRDVRRFLPVLLDWRNKIRIPTPVTVHIDSCPQCHKDLISLSRLNLEPKQLARLSKFYSGHPQADSIQCKDAWESIDLAAEFRFDKVPLKVIEHICLCRGCRELLYDKRRIIIKTICQSDKNEDWPCELVNPSDLFDMAFPFGIDSSDTENFIFRGPFINHVKNCPRCLEKLDYMSRILYSINEHQDSGIATRYELEQEKPNLDLSYGRDIFDQAGFADFAHWPQGARINCEQVKRFLPLLADVETKIKVPAASIAHVEQCSKCREDLNTIRSWKLDYKKHIRLAEFLSQETFEQSGDCARIQENKAKIIESLAGMSFGKLSRETLNHVCLCRSCRDMVYKARQELPMHTNNSANSEGFLCEDIKPADLFDYVFPYGLDPAGDEYAKFRQPFIRHLRSCLRCLEKIRQLHNSIYAIAERGRIKAPASYEPDKKAVIGHWHTAQARRIAERIDDLDDEQFETLLAHLSMAGEDPYQGWGINVQIVGEAGSRPGKAEHLTAASEEKDLCEIAPEYMYDMVYPENKGLVPAQVQAHIESCSYCAKELTGIKEFLAEHAGFRAQSKAVAMARLGAYTKEHFEFIGQEVDCSCVKEFLPLLADSKLQITIPTPVTVHLDECSQCAKDVSILRSLNLKSIQLDTIAEFYGETAFDAAQDDYPFGYCVVHKHADNIIESFVRMRFEDLSPKIIRRICLCRDCRDKVYKKRLACIMEIDSTAEHDSKLCASIKTSDLLSYCLPRYFDMADDWYKQLDESVTEHLRHCRVCLQKLQLLHRAIFNIADRANSGVATCYELAPVGWNKDNPNAPIGCKTLRPYLPGFVNEPVGLMVPSALAAHLDECQQCMDDFGEIDLLQLNKDQLRRLKQIFIGKPEKTNVSCGQAQAAIAKVEALKFNEIDPKILEHIRRCPDCRQKLYQRRQMIIDEFLPDGLVEDGFNCDLVRQADLFDYCFPPGNNTAKLYPGLTKHLVTCRKCLRRMQELHKKVCELAEKPSTGILTENPVPVPANEKEGFLPLDYQYPQWPIKVWTNSKAETEVQQAAEAEYADYLRTKTPAGVISFAEKLKERTAAVVNLKNIRKTAAAAMIPIAIGLFLYFFFSMGPSVAMARTYSEVVSSVKKIVNVCIRKYKPGQVEPTQTEWISKTLNVHLFKTGNQMVLRDLSNRVIRVKDLISGQITTLPISDEKFAVFQTEYSGTFNIVPFEDLAEVPGAKWNQVDSKDINRLPLDAEVYDLTWYKSINQTMKEYHKRRYFFSSVRTNVPKKVEVYLKKPFEKNYTLWEYCQIATAPDETEICNHINGAFGSAILNMKAPAIQGQSDLNGSIPR